MLFKAIIPLMMSYGKWETINLKMFSEDFMVNPSQFSIVASDENQFF